MTIAKRILIGAGHFLFFWAIMLVGYTMIMLKISFLIFVWSWIFG